MEISYPKYYKHFACIASACPDSCCKEWGVDVDEKSARYYRSLPGDLGQRLRQALKDTDDGTVMVIEDGRCPMWRQDSLCRIQAELGHDALCKVCREFPRLRHDYGNFTELGLELSCPEAARLILSDWDGIWVTETAPDGDVPDYDEAVMKSLLRSREAFLTFLNATSLPFPRILAVLLLYAYGVQEELDGGNPAQLNPEHSLLAAEQIDGEGNAQALYDFFLQLEILTPHWKAHLETAPEKCHWDMRHKALLRYFIGRYWLQAVSDYDIVCRVKFAVASCILIGFLGGDLLETAQLFSKEIENDPDNVEAILDGAYTAPCFTDCNLLRLLLL